MPTITDDEVAHYKRLLREDGEDVSLEEAREAARRMYALVELVVEMLRDPKVRESLRIEQREREIKIWSSQDGQLAILLLKRGPARGRRYLT